MDPSTVTQLLFVVLLSGGAIWFVKYSKGQTVQDREPIRGVGGWLIIPIIGFVGVIILTSINLAAVFTEFESMRVIFLGTQEQFNPLRLPVALSLLSGLAVVVSASVCLYKIAFTKVGLRKIAVTHYILLAFASCIDLWADSVIVASAPGTLNDPAAIKGAARGVVAAFIWIPYFLLSKRVENTFERSAENAEVGGV